MAEGVESSYAAAAAAVVVFTKLPLGPKGHNCVAKGQEELFFLHHICCT